MVGLGVIVGSNPDIWFKNELDPFDTITDGCGVFVTNQAQCGSIIPNIHITITHN